MSDNKSKGALGESLAETYLVKKGFQFAKKNYRYKRSEIDLIVRNEQLIVFVEVKYRSSNTFGEPESFVSPNQQVKIIEAADEFIHHLQWQGNIRFDIIAINSKNEIEHFEDAFH